MGSHARWNLLFGLALVLLVASDGQLKSDHDDGAAQPSTGNQVAEDAGGAGEDIAHARESWLAIREHGTTTRRPGTGST